CIDQEVKKIVTRAYTNARKILEGNRDTLERIATALLEREVLDGNEVTLLVEGKPLPEKKTAPPPTPEPVARPTPAPQPAPKPVAGFPKDKPATA
ncbi:MAG: cell division protein FtsH, partial [Candidatus Acidiferrales bacterium]